MNEPCEKHGIGDCPECVFVPLGRLHALQAEIDRLSALSRPEAEIHKVNADAVNVLRHLLGSIEAVLEDDEVKNSIECRMDDDCDHCVLMDAMKSAEASLKDAEHFTKNPDAKFERPEAGEAAKDYSKLRKIPEAFSELIETVILREKQLCAELASLRANSVSGEAVDAVIEAAKRMNEWEWSAVLAESAMHSDDKAEIQQASIELSAALAKLSAGNTQEKK